MTKIKISKKELEYLYHEKKYSMRKIAKHLGYGYNTIKRRIIEFDIQKRSRTESTRLSYKQMEEDGVFDSSRVSLICPECDKEITIIKGRIKKGRKNFCSKSCSSTYYKRINPRYNGDEKPCYYCGEKVYKPAHHKNIAERRFCDLECFFNNRVETKELKGKNNSRYNKLILPCSVCEKKVKRTPSKIYNTIYCSYDCMAVDYQKRFKGEKNPNYVDGLSLYYGPNWDKISLAIRKRDENKCIRCLNIFNEKGTLDVHHIVPFRLFNEDYAKANHPSNLVSLCKKCHKTVEHHGIDFELPSECIVQPTTD